MDTKEILARLDIVKVATTIGDQDTIDIQSKYLSASGSSALSEIATLLNGKNYRQALYLIKDYLSKMGDTERLSFDIPTDEQEKVLDIEDMLRMSPLAKETIKDYKRSAYTEDDLEAFAKNIETPLVNEKINYDNAEIEKISNEVDIEDEKGFVENIEEDIAQENSIQESIQNEKNNEISEEQSQKLTEAIDNADDDTPLDEISAEVLGSSVASNKRKKVLSKYHNIREKFSKKRLDNIEDEKSSIEDEDNIKNEDVNIESDNSTINNIETKENIKNSSNIAGKLDESIYAPIPHIEEKFRQAFVLYPPVKESDVWIEEVVKFLKYISKNSFMESDINNFLNEYRYYLEKNDIAKAAQVLLLASCIDSKYAQFLLARELFNGKIIARDLKKSFAIMKSLANEYYPEAVCDLAQFYEYGIGTNRDKNIAIKLYEKAFELGVNRASKHIDRLKESSGIFSKFLKK